ncbi:hypothetical protein B0T22DRAFT_275498 [Podospora appendiculata]|uniref:Cellobiose dehydrogenase-like cytochrome domain-containing protein n=1 Tax=Podospora appendiculata TaxID=314037 RepID=A0AAE0X0D7_9PEZI|nr:hypothetical protein B0T22DRAFT_275498 [Podospora appendiculata]
MHLPRAITGLAALAGLAPRQFPADSAVHVDKETGLTFASYTSDAGIEFRVAIPGTIPTNLVYETVIQVVAPIKIGWAGFAWGGAMTYNPLTIAWPNGTHNIVLSSRIAYGYYSPPAYTSANYTILKKGTHINATHWQYTASCNGCSSWGDADTGFSTLDPSAQTTMAYAYSNSPVDTPSSETSSFGIHDSLGHPIFDLSEGKNADFAAKVKKAGKAAKPRHH